MKNIIVGVICVMGFCLSHSVVYACDDAHVMPTEKVLTKEEKAAQEKKSAARRAEIKRIREEVSKNFKSVDDIPKSRFDIKF